MLNSGFGDRRAARYPIPATITTSTGNVTAASSIPTAPATAIQIYSTTFAAVASSVSGTVSPSALAALRLIDRSNFETW